ncbi:hypothetical protein D3C85_1947470 [compost metagenome]
MARTLKSSRTAAAIVPSNVCDNPKATEAAGRLLRVARAASGGRAQPRDKLANNVI